MYFFYILILFFSLCNFKINILYLLGFKFDNKCKLVKYNHDENLCVTNIEIINKGKIIGEGTHLELVKNSAYYRNLYDKQSLN